MSTSFLVVFVIVAALAVASALWVLTDAAFRKSGVERKIRLWSCGLALVFGAALAWIVLELFIAAGALGEDTPVWHVMPFTGLVSLALVAYMDRVVLMLPLVAARRLNRQDDETPR